MKQKNISLYRQVIGAKGEPARVTGLSLTGFGRLTWKEHWTSNWDWTQPPGRNNTEVIYSCSDQDKDFGDDMTWRADENNVWSRKIFHILRCDLRMYFNQTRGKCGKTNQDCVGGVFFLVYVESEWTLFYN